MQKRGNQQSISEPNWTLFVGPHVPSSKSESSDPLIYGLWVAAVLVCKFLHSKAKNDWTPIDRCLPTTGVFRQEMSSRAWPQVTCFTDSRTYRTFPKLRTPVCRARPQPWRLMYIYIYNTYTIIYCIYLKVAFKPTSTLLFIPCRAHIWGAIGLFRTAWTPPVALTGPLRRQWSSLDLLGLGVLGRLVPLLKCSPTMLTIYCPHTGSWFTVNLFLDSVGAGWIKRVGQPNRCFP